MGGRTSRGKQWLLLKTKDEHAVRGETAVALGDRSVKSGRTIEPVARYGGLRKRRGRAENRQSRPLMANLPLGRGLVGCAKADKEFLSSRQRPHAPETPRYRDRPSRIGLIQRSPRSLIIADLAKPRTRRPAAAAPKE
jgi:hypothetical protein